MWQKLNRLDTIELEKARIQILNAVQLVSAVPRSYLPSKKGEHQDWLTWNSKSSAIESKQLKGTEPVKVSLDLEQFVLSVHGSNQHIEHLVLSGLTYPMAFGWMKIKLDSFNLDSDEFSDDTGYRLERVLGPDEEINVTNQQVFSSIAIYYSNASEVLAQLSSELNLNPVLNIMPSTLNLQASQVEKSHGFSIGFSPGDKSYPDPYFYIRIDDTNENLMNKISRSVGIWNTKDWHGLVFLASDFLTLEPEDEKNKVIDFFRKSFPTD